jgi:hypothetical protein
MSTQEICTFKIMQTNAAYLQLQIYINRQNKVLSSNDPCCSYFARLPLDVNYFARLPLDVNNFAPLPLDVNKFAPLPLDVTNFKKSTTEEIDFSVLREDRHKNSRATCISHTVTYIITTECWFVWAAMEGSTNTFHSCTGQKNTYLK